ncbi:MAG: WG repeat-containing protein [Bacteroidia bacterium]
MIRIALLFLLLTASTVAFAQRGSQKMLKGYDAIYPFKNGKAKVEKGGKIGYINLEGEEIIPPIYDAIYPFERGVAKVEKAGLIGMINEQGEILLEAVYDYIGPNKNGLVVVTRFGKRGLCKITGNTPDDVEYIVDIR